MLNKNEKKIYFLEKKFTFKNFINSQKFINKVGEISEEEGASSRYFFWMGVCKNYNFHSCNRRFIRK